jgi:glutathione synthase/RimK-type ligase-like ATP-grasp enzyme
MAVSLRARARYLAKRARSFRLGRVWGFATQISKEQGKHPVPVLIDMLYSAAFRDTAYLDYYEADFALLTRAERATFMTSLLQHHLAEALNDREAAKTFENKIAFNTAFAEFLHREWIDLSTAGVDELRSFAERHPVIIAKVPVSREGKGVFRYDTAEVSDWTAFHADLVSKGQVLIEQPIVQHPYLAKYVVMRVVFTVPAQYFAR